MQAPPDVTASCHQPAAGPPPGALSAASAASALRRANSPGDGGWASPGIDLLVAACLHPAAHQLAVLRRILETHSGVQLLAPVSGQAARAAELSSEGLLSLLQAVPPTSYAQQYEPCMQAALAAADAGDTAGALAQLAQVCGEPPAVGGASGQLWQTSGTTGKAKVVPVTPSLLAEQGKVCGL